MRLAVIGGEKVPVDRIHQFNRWGPADATLHQHPAPITYEIPDLLGGMGGQAVGPEGLVKPGGNPREGIHEGPIKIKDGGVDGRHARAAGY